MLILNYLDHSDEECGDPHDIYIVQCGSPVSAYVFHLIEVYCAEISLRKGLLNCFSALCSGQFTATFMFSVVQAFTLLYTPKSLLEIYDNPIVLKLVLFFAIVRFRKRHDRYK